MAVYNIYGLFATFVACLRRLWPFATFRDICNVEGCLLRLGHVCGVYGLFATFMVCLHLLCQLASCMAVCNV